MTFETPRPSNQQPPRRSVIAWTYLGAFVMVALSSFERLWWIVALVVIFGVFFGWTLGDLIEAQHELIAEYRKEVYPHEV